MRNGIEGPCGIVRHFQCGPTDGRGYSYIEPVKYQCVYSALLRSENQPKKVS